MSRHETTRKLQAALDGIVPVDCIGEVAMIAEVPVGGLSAEEISLTKSWASHRQQEFAAGRQCARRALAGFGVEPVTLLPDEDRVPAWPEGFLGSITHCRGIAAAVAAPSTSYSRLGLDLEKTNRLGTSAMRRVVHPLEAKFAGEDSIRGTLLFSLKEAFYKAQFPLGRTTGNFRNLALNVDLGAGVASVAYMDARFAPELRDLCFAFRFVDAYALSLCYYG